jgi:hypothetical protein
MSEAGNRKLGNEIGLMMLTPRTDTWTLQSEKEEIPPHSLSASGIRSSPTDGVGFEPTVRYELTHTFQVWARQTSFG